MREELIDAIFLELSNKKHACGIPSKEQLLLATHGNPVTWDAEESFVIGEIQTEESFNNLIKIF